MRSTPSLDRGRFALPLDLVAAAATGAMVVVAILVLGWLTSGLITGVWWPREQPASVAGSDVTLVARSDRDDAPRAPRARASASVRRPTSFASATASSPAVRCRFFTASV
jgi:hypothetical protein